MDVEKGIPIPQDRIGGGVKRFMWDEFSVGDSLHVETKAEIKSVRQSFRSHNLTRKIVGAKMKTRRVDDSDPKGQGYRAWIVSKGAPDEI